MDDTKRILIAFAIIFLVLIVWQFIFRPPAQTGKPAETAKPGNEVVKPETTKPAITPPTEIKKTTEPVLPETETVLENSKLRIVFSNQGGVIKSVWLRLYKAELVPKGSSFFATTLQTEQSLLDLSNQMMSVKATDSTIEYEKDLAGLKIKKVWHLNEDYSLNLSLQVEGANPEILTRVDHGMAPTEPNIPDDLMHYRFYCKGDKQINGYAGKKLKNGLSRADKLDWVGLRNKYFLLTLVGLSDKFDMTNASLLPDNRIAFSAGTKSTSPETKFLVLISPLKYDLLKSYGMGIENTVELGWPKPFSYAILKILDFLFRIFRNYGIAIIVFSILMKGIFWPLTHSSTKQMHQMQLLQPKMDELKKKYKNDPQGLNRETMQLYKIYKINPFSGCLPLIIQMPIFWALYWVLRFTFDLRQASFVFWLKDLSLKDPYYILPILMGVSFLIQSLLTSADKRNMALQVFMPIFMTVIFLNFPSGLQLYWFIYNILSILESMIVRKGGLSWRKAQPANSPLTNSLSK
jgi:YidC/Oxa1 family membrane protein insertase